MQRKWLFAISLCIAMTGLIGIATPRANAGALVSSVQIIKPSKSSIVENARYRCWWRNGRRHCRWVGGWRGPRHCWWRNGRRICRW